MGHRRAVRVDVGDSDDAAEQADVTEAAAYLRDAGFVTGETLNVNGGELMR